jgi:hypothetical protein
MRTLLKASFNTEAANRAIRDDHLPRLIEDMLEQLNPEAAYFGTENGLRTMYVVFDLKEPAQLPSVAEPLFQTVQAQITTSPVMTHDEVKAGLAKARGKS